MGDIVRQDRAYTIAVLHKLLSMYEMEWEQLGYAMPRHALSSCMFLLVSCLGGLRGFEVMWTDLSALRYDVQFCEAQMDFTAVSWPVVGRFKAHQGVLGCYMIPIAGTTDSEIPFFTWTRRFINSLAKEVIQEGWAFQRPNGERGMAGDYREEIFTKLEQIQATTTLIDPDCNIWDAYGMQRSGRCFLTTHATNEGVSPHDIELQCRWSTDRAKGERSVQRSMLHTYSEIRNMKEALIRPSKAC